MCDRTHRYTVEIMGRAPRYSGPDEAPAIEALLSTGDCMNEGYVTAEHEDGSTCPAEADRIADVAEAVLAERDAQAAQQGTTPFALYTSDTAWIARNHGVIGDKGRVYVQVSAADVETFDRIGRPWIRHVFADVPSDALNAAISCPVAFVAGKVA